MYIVYNLLFTITINIENYYYKTINTRWLYKISRLHKFTHVQYLSFGKSLVIPNVLNISCQCIHCIYYK